VGQTRLRYLLDHTDDPVIPAWFQRGNEFRWFDQSPGANGAFPSMDLKLGFFQPIARRASLFVESEGAPPSATPAREFLNSSLAGRVGSAPTAKTSFRAINIIYFAPDFCMTCLPFLHFSGKKSTPSAPTRSENVRRDTGTEFPTMLLQDFSRKPP